MKKERDAAKKNSELAEKKSEAAEKKRKQESGVNGGSPSNPTKWVWNRVREAAASPPDRQGCHSLAPSTKLSSQPDNEATASPTLWSQPQKSPSQAPTEVGNPEDNDEENGYNNRYSRTPEAAIDNDAQRSVNKSIENCFGNYYDRVELKNR